MSQLLACTVVFDHVQAVIHKQEMHKQTSRAALLVQDAHHSALCSLDHLNLLCVVTAVTVGCHAGICHSLGRTCVEYVNE